MSQSITLTLAQKKLDGKTKPAGALGELEAIAVRLAVMQQTLYPSVGRKRLVVYAGSHGVAAEGISAYPAEVTWQMVWNFLAGGAAISVLARHGNIDLRVVDVGVDTAPNDALNHRMANADNADERMTNASADERVTNASADERMTNASADAGIDMRIDKNILQHPAFFNRRIRQGTRNFLREPAMTAPELVAALDAGREQVRLAVTDEVELLGVGEMGIGNTASASAVLAMLTGFSAEELVGRGTGIDDATLARKTAVLKRSLFRHAPAATLPPDAQAMHALSTVGGYELAAITGTLLEAAERGIPVVVDGFIATAAAAAAIAIEHRVKEICFFGHRSAEAAHSKVLEWIGVTPLLSLEMRLGEGTGAALAMFLIDAAAKLMSEMASFDAAGVSEKPAALR